MQRRRLDRDHTRIYEYYNDLQLQARRKLATLAGACPYRKSNLTRQ